MLQLQCWLISLKFKYGEDSWMKLTWFESFFFFWGGLDLKVKGLN